MQRIYFVYILTNRSNKVLYTGVTNDLARRVHEHKMGMLDGFTKKYNVNKLVYFETFDWIDEAIKKEKQIKSYRREKKVNLIVAVNPEWNELRPSIKY